MMEMCAELSVAKAEQGEQIAKLTTKIDLLTKLVGKLLSQKPTPATTTTTKKYMDCEKCDKRHKKGMYWEDKKNAANRPRNWKSVKTKDELGSLKFVKGKRKHLSSTIKLETKINSQPLIVPTPLTNQVEVLATINQKTTKTKR